MLIEKKIFEDEDGKRYIEAIYDSSNILKTIYFEHLEKFYIFFKKGKAYSYVNINKKLYEIFENAESQGIIFNKEIKNKPEFEYRYEFKLLESEVNEALLLIENFKKDV